MSGPTEPQRLRHQQSHEHAVLTAVERDLVADPDVCDALWTFRRASNRRADRAVAEANWDREAPIVVVVGSIGLLATFPHSVPVGLACFVVVLLAVDRTLRRFGIHRSGGTDGGDAGSGPVRRRRRGRGRRGRAR